MSGNINTILMEITARCRNCGGIIAINALINHVWCPECKSEKVLSFKFWSLFLNEIMSISNEMQFGEARMTSFNDETIGILKVSFKKNSQLCNNCRQVIPFDENDEMHCEKCGEYVNKRKIPNEIVSLNMLSLLDEDICQINEGKNNSFIDKPLELNCSSCGATLKVDGDKRLINCPACNVEILLPDDVWHRLHPSLHIRPWYLVFRSSSEDEPKPWKFDKINGVCCDSENILYCVGETENEVHAIWAMSNRCELKWMTLLPANKRWPDYFSEIELLADETLIIWNEDVSIGLVYEKKNGDFIKEIGGKEPFDSKVHTLDFCDISSFAADPDGSMVAIIERRILRFSKEGEGIFLWPKTILDFQKLQSIYMNNEREPDKRGANDIRGGGFVLPQKLKNKTTICSFLGKNSVHIGKDSHLYILAPYKGNEKNEILGGAILTKFNRNGKIIYKADLEVYGVEQYRTKTDDDGYAYVMIFDAREEFESATKIIRISPDGSEIKVIVRIGNYAIDPSQDPFTVTGDGTIYTIGSGNQMRVYTHSGELIWRNISALEYDRIKNREKEATLN